MPISKRGIAAALAAGVFLASGSLGHAQAPTDFNKMYQDAPAIFASLSGLRTERSRPNNGTIVQANPGGVPSFTTGRDFDFDWSTNIDASIGVRFWRTEAIELRFLNFNSDAAHTFVTPGGFIGAGFTGPSGTLFQGQAETRMQSWEINWRHQLFDQLTVLAGFRDIQLNDQLGYAINTTVARGQYDYNNSLLGAQIGVDWAVLPLTNPLQVNLWGKIGLYRLRTDGGITEFSGSTPIGGFSKSERDQVHAAEAGVTVGYRVSDTVTVRAGYQALWLDKLGLASNNASSSILNPSLLSTHIYRGDLLLQSVSIGLAIGY
jgi:hypothetical protein